jgi:hypothetical protein
MHIAAKYEEIYPPFIKDYIHIADDQYTKKQMMELEVQILQTLNFKITWPTTLTFLDRYSKLARLN